MTDEMITFQVWFILRDDGLQMVDSDESAALCGNDAEFFGPFRITIPMPESIALCIRERSATIEGKVLTP